MTARRSRLKTTFAVLVFSFAAFGAGAARAQEAESPTHEAAKHFQRGVALYGEADYRAALVEFKRAYTIAPNAAVLYNVGETEYQLQDYAGALGTFRRYLSEAAPNEAHRAEVENNVETLRSRVGHVNVTTSPPGADVTIDDQPVGKTPLEQPVLVSIGHRKISAALPGRAPVTRYVDVAADDNVALALQLPAAEPSAMSDPRTATAATEPSHASAGAGPALRIAGWATTGACVAGAVTFGLLAEKASSDLKNARASYPTTNATLNHDANLTTTYAAVADALTAAALVVGGITLVSTVTSSSSHHKTESARVVLGPASAQFDMTF